jgi:RimJ/RimL family protein N-acetyltransferase
MEVDGKRAAELAYDIRSDFWNHGFASEPAVAVRDYAFNILQISQFISLIRWEILLRSASLKKRG